MGHTYECKQIQLYNLSDTQGSNIAAIRHNDRRRDERHAYTSVARRRPPISMGYGPRDGDREGMHARVGIYTSR